MPIDTGTPLTARVDGQISGFQPFETTLTDIGKELNDAGIFVTAATGDAPDLVPGIVPASTVPGFGTFGFLPSHYRATLSVTTRQPFATVDAVGAMISRAFTDHGATSVSVQVAPDNGIFDPSGIVDAAAAAAKGIGSELSRDVQLLIVGLIVIGSVAAFVWAAK